MNPTPLIAALFLAVASPASALEWHSMGARSVGMGGAGVALAEGPLASYWNPAALGRASVNSYGGAIHFGGHVALSGSVYEGAKNLQQLKDRGTTPTQAEINDALDKLDQPGGLRFDGGLGLNARVGKLGFFFNAMADAGAVSRVDKNPARSGTTTFQQNQSKLVVKGANIIELGAAYGHELPFAPGLYLGGALKLMNAHVGYTDYAILSNNNDSGNITSKLTDSATKSSNFGVDAGLLWDVARTFDGAALKPRVGVTARNINNPKFKQPAAATAAGVTNKFAANPQVRLGTSLSPMNWWNLALDVDLTRNLTPVDGTASRQVSLGTEFNVFNRSWINIPLRAGLMRNTEDPAAGTTLTLGAGLNLMHFMLDLSGGVSNRNVRSSTNEKFPREAFLGAQVSLLFGGADKEPARERTSPAPDAPPTDQPANTDTIRKASEKAQEDLKVEELKNATPEKR